MTTIVDANAVFAAADLSDPRGPGVATLLRSRLGPFILPAPITAEIDYLLNTRLGFSSARRFYADLSRGRFTVACLEGPEYAQVEALSERYSDLNPGLADLSIVVLARRFNTRRILTFDERHFRAIRPLQGGEFEILPGIDTAQA